MSSVIKKGDLGAVDEVLGWDPRGDAEEYDMLEKAQEAFSRIKKELSSQKKSLKEEKQRYDELFRMTESYIKRLHAAEEENKRLREVTASYIQTFLNMERVFVMRQDTIQKPAMNAD